MENIICTFDQKLALSDVSKLCNAIGTVIPIPVSHHLINNKYIGLSQIFSTTKDYLQIKEALRKMNLTILRNVEGNQLILKKPTHGMQYLIKNTGPFPLEKGDTLCIIPPSSAPQTPKIMSLGHWELVLPLTVPSEVATEVNLRLICMGLLSAHKTLIDIRAAIEELRIIRYRDVTVTLPDVTNNDKLMFDIKNACIAFSMIMGLAPDIVYTYINQIALEDQSMLIIKCQELLSKRLNIDVDYDRPNIENVNDEIKKLKTIFTMINQIHTIIEEKASFIICDVSPDNKQITCIFKE
uniref:Probable capsid protein n=1 Tax=Suid betaherpesvirus 2 TaxID=1608255 RepID=Q998F5_9BETA|nr:probable capsid protein [Suid betaherpesvirus 2]